MHNIYFCWFELCSWSNLKGKKRLNCENNNLNVVIVAPPLTSKCRWLCTAHDKIKNYFKLKPKNTKITTTTTTNTKKTIHTKCERLCMLCFRKMRNGTSRIEQRHNETKSKATRKPRKRKQQHIKKHANVDVHMKNWFLCLVFFFDTLVLRFGDIHKYIFTWKCANKWTKKNTHTHTHIYSA